MSKINIIQSEKYLERISLKYFLHLSSRFKCNTQIKIKGIPSDETLEIVSRNTTINTLLIAFWVGVLAVIPAVYFEISYKGTMDSFYYYSILSLIALVFLFAEMAILYWLSMKAVYALSALVGYDEEKTLPNEYDSKKMMIRSVLDIEEPIFRYLGIDSEEIVSKKMLLFTMLLYKIKKGLSKIILKFLIKKVATRYSLRVTLYWIAIPISGVWDSISIYFVIKSAKLKLFGSKLSRYIAEDILNKQTLQNYAPSMQEACIRVVSTVIVRSKNRHPNNIILLFRLNENMEIEEKNNYQDLNILLQYLETAEEKEKHLLRCLAGISAIFDAQINKGTKEALSQIFGDKEEKYMIFAQELKALLLAGRLHQSAFLCEWMLSESAKKHYDKLT
jgi:hypothetical protein